MVSTFRRFLGKRMRRQRAGMLMCVKLVARERTKSRNPAENMLAG
jgi:hypothetical protein